MDLLFKICLLHRFKRAERIEQAPVVRAPVTRFHGRVLGGDQPLAYKPLHMLCHRVVAHVHRLADGGVARMALKGLSVLAVHQIGVHENFTRSQPQAKDAFRHRKIFAGDVAGVVTVKCSVMFAQ